MSIRWRSESRTRLTAIAHEYLQQCYQHNLKRATRIAGVTFYWEVMAPPVARAGDTLQLVNLASKVNYKTGHRAL
jgi:hypothetical protein